MIPYIKYYYGINEFSFVWKLWCSRWSHWIHFIPTNNIWWKNNVLINLPTHTWNWWPNTIHPEKQVAYRFTLADNRPGTMKISNSQQLASISSTTIFERNSLLQFPNNWDWWPNTNYTMILNLFAVDQNFPNKQYLVGSN